MPKELLNINSEIMQENGKKNCAGFSLVEALLSIALFAILVTVFISSLIYGQDSQRMAGDRARANFLAEEGMEATRNMRDENFANLTIGTHGLSMAGNQWGFSGSNDVTDIFTREIVVSEVDDYRKKVLVNVSWKQNEQREGLIALENQLTNWRALNLTEAEQLSVNFSNAQVQAGLHPKVYDVTMENIGAEVITIVSTEISWAGVPSGARLQEITMDGSSVWTGDDVSGSGQDISDFILVPGSNTYPLEFIFDKSINGITLTVIFTMADRSIKKIEFTPGDPADIIPPGDINSLVASGATTSSVDLTWVAPGDDDNAGTATSYDIRYSTSMINDSNWNSATHVSGEPNPAPAGATESMTISGLSPETTYYFAIKTSDEVPNESGLSNVVNATTVAISQASDLLVNTAGVGLASANRNVIGITLQNSGSASITISSMIVSWTGVVSNRRLQTIRISGSDVWTGSAVSGTTENISDVTLISGATAIPLDYLRFSGAVNGIVLSISFNMADGSTKTLSGITP